MFTEAQIEEIVDILTEAPNSKLYFGCDSVRYKKNKKWWARYATVFIVHRDQSKGCTIFKNISKERDYDQKPHMPKIRLMNEVSKVCELYTQLAPFIDQFEVEVHLDISPNPENGSNCVAQQAVGYVAGVTGLDAENIKIKSDAFAASAVADKVC